MDLYSIAKSLHVISVISWMAGLLYLPRLFVYHCEAAPGSESSEKFKVMERRLLRGIMNPAMIASWIFGIYLAIQINAFGDGGWFHAKFLCVILMTGMHMVMARHRRLFEQDANTRSQKYFRILNEGPTILMVIIVFMVIGKPF